MPGPFYFDQSSAHAALAPNTLKAFNMNKSNGGAQQKQKDTIIPESNPFPEYRGRIQKMTTESGEKKGLQQTLEECGFNVVTFMPNVHPSVCLRTIIAAWHAFSVNKMTSLTKFPCSKV